MIGRRVFTRRLRFPNGLYRTRIFHDDRLGTGLSFDRLGVRQADAEVLRFLAPLAERMAAKGGRPFTGWAQARVGDFRELTVVATRAEGEDNPYHAEIDREHYTSEEALYTLAQRIAVEASRYDFLPAAPPTPG